jgi:AraC-like DNA-binding protein
MFTLLNSSNKQKMLNLVEDPSMNHVRAMAEYFNAELDEGNDASTITMDNEQAKGFISSYRLFRGLSVWVYNVTFLTDFEVDLDLSEYRPHYFCYNVKGHFFHRIGDQDKFVKILQNQNMIVIGSPEKSVQIVLPANVELKIAIITVDLKLLESLDIRNAKRICENVGDLFTKIPKHRTYRHLGGIDTETEKYASIVCENNNIDLVGGLLTEGAVLNMLASQITAYSKDITKARPKSTLSKSELSKITSLGDYVLNNLETGITILELSKHFGISPKKLQMGVRHLYGDSVGHYVSNLRMGHAKHLFNTTDLNVSEVRYRVGIFSGSYFSKVFKSRYGTLPSQHLN